MKGIIIHNKKNEYAGYLGNRIFQWASTIGIAKKNGMQYAFPKHEYMDYFNGDFHVNNSVNEWETVDYLEPNFKYNEVILNANLNYNLLGYFQSYKYFKHCEEEIRKLFDFKNEIKQYINSKYLNNIPPSKPLVALHFRRGDYINYPECHPILSLNYYIESIKLIKQQIGGEIQIVIFSNDFNWCENNIKESDFGCDILFAKDNNQGQDMFFMSQCNLHVIANSTMSWWGAWLCDFKHKMVIAPKKELWFGKARKTQEWSVNDLYLDNFISI